MFLGSGTLASTTVNGGGGADSFVFSSNTVSGSAGSVFAGGAGTDVFSGAVTISGGGVSFWGGAGNDTFTFTDIVSSGTAATAYFWNEAGDDSLTFGDGISIGSGYGAAIFGVSSGSSVAGLNISFGAGNTTNLFGANDSSTGFYIGASGNTLVATVSLTLRSLLSGLVVPLPHFKAVLWRLLIPPTCSLTPRELEQLAVQRTLDLQLQFQPSADLVDFTLHLLLPARGGFFCLVFSLNRPDAGGSGFGLQLVLTYCQLLLNFRP